MEQERNHHQSGQQALEIARGASHETLAALLAEIDHLRRSAYDAGMNGQLQIELALHVGDGTPILNLLAHFVAEISTARRIEFLASLRSTNDD